MDNIWQTKYAAATMQEGKMVIQYQFPFSRQREADLLGSYNLAPNMRLNYYQTLSTMAERNFVVADYLKSQEVPSILTFETVYQQQEGSTICINAIPEEPVTPITTFLFATDCNALTALDVFLRLTHILRDINKTPISPVLRYLDMDDVYLTQDNKIKLGGFYYAAADGLADPPPFLPDAAPVIPERIMSGEKGDIGTDMQALSMIAWNVFSGLPWDCKHTATSKRIAPTYAPDQLLRILEMGLNGNPEDFTAFRKLMLQCRKELAKTDFATLVIPMKRMEKKIYHFTAPAKEDTDDDATDT